MGDERERHGGDGDAFLGYRLRALEETLDRNFQWLRLQLGILDRKISAIGGGMTPEETRAHIAEINAEAAKVEDAFAKTAKATEQLKKTGV